jgi:hypothetical protein
MLSVIMLSIVGHNAAMGVNYGRKWLIVQATGCIFKIQNTFSSFTLTHVSDKGERKSVKSLDKDVLKYHV